MGQPGSGYKILMSPEKIFLSCHAEQNGSLLAGHRKLAACFCCQITDHGATADEALASLYTRPTFNASSGRSTLQANAQAGTKKWNFCLRAKFNLCNNNNVSSKTLRVHFLVELLLTEMQLQLPSYICFQIFVFYPRLNGNGQKAALNPVFTASW